MYDKKMDAAQKKLDEAKRKKKKKVVPENLDIASSKPQILPVPEQPEAEAEDEE